MSFKYLSNLSMSHIYQFHSHQCHTHSYQYHTRLSISHTHKITHTHNTPIHVTPIHVCICIILITFPFLVHVLNYSPYQNIENGIRFHMQGVCVIYYFSVCFIINAYAPYAIFFFLYVSDRSILLYEFWHTYLRVSECLLVWNKYSFFVILN